MSADFCPFAVDAYTLVHGVRLCQAMYAGGIRPITRPRRVAPVSNTVNGVEYKNIVLLWCT